jgi:hypothetical protein
MKLQALAERPGGLALAPSPTAPATLLRYCTSFAGCGDMAPGSKSSELRQYEVGIGQNK